MASVLTLMVKLRAKPRREYQVQKISLNITCSFARESVMISGSSIKQFLKNLGIPYYLYHKEVGYVKMLSAYIVKKTYIYEHFCRPSLG